MRAAPARPHDVPALQAPDDLVAIGHHGTIQSGSGLGQYLVPAIRTGGHDRGRTDGHRALRQRLAPGLGPVVAQEIVVGLAERGNAEKRKVQKMIW